MKPLFWSAMVLGLVSGCGEGSPEAGDATPECEKLLSTYCGRVNECSLNINEQECLTEVRTQINCGEAAAVDDDYDRCLEEIELSTCGSLFGASIALPASCNGAIKVIR